MFISVLIADPAPSSLKIEKLLMGHPPLSLGGIHQIVILVDD
jgi:hypothetical protein